MTGFGLAFQPYLLQDDDIPTLIEELKKIFDETEGGKNNVKKDTVRTIHYLDLVKRLSAPWCGSVRPCAIFSRWKTQDSEPKTGCSDRKFEGLISGILVDQQYMRRYPQNEHKYEDEDDKPWKLGAHLLGYLGARLPLRFERIQDTMSIRCWDARA